jgi:hypothetical protein
MTRSLVTGFALALAACGQDNLVLPTEGDVAKIEIVSGDGQDGQSGAPLENELVVLVRDGLDRPVVGQSVSFAPANAASGEVTEATVVTDAEGLAATEWILGPTAGPQQVRAGVIVDGAVASELLVTFSATAAAGNAARLVIKVQPTDVVAGVAMSPAVQVEVQDQNGNRVSGATTPVTLALASNPAAGTLSGRGPVNAVGGIATFAGLSLNRSGSGYTVTATAPGFAAATSVAFNVSAAAPHHLEFTLPSAVAAGASIAPAQVAVRDVFGNLVTSPSASITVAIGDNPAGGTLSGTKTIATAGGIASFSNLSIDRAGNDYTLQATGGGLNLESAELDVLPGNVNRLAFVTSPSGAIVGGSLGTVRVRVLDAQGNLVATATNAIRIVSSVSGVLTGTNLVSAVNGIATFSNLAITKAGTDYQLIALTSGLADATSDQFDVAKAGTSTEITTKTPSGASVVGQPVTVNYDVDVDPSGSGSLTGTVLVSDGTTSCVGGVTAAGAGSCQLTFGDVGAPALTATYSGDANFEGSASAVRAHTVNKASTTTVITSDNPNPSEVGEAVVVVWDVNVSLPGGGTPGGTVTVTMAGDPATCSKPVAIGSCELVPTTVGDNRTLTATYSGDASYNGSSDTDPHVVDRMTTTTTITSVSPDPAFASQPATVTFTVTRLGGSPTGTVTVTAGVGESCSATVAAGTCDLTFLTSGNSRTITATYAGDGTFKGSSDTHTLDVGLLNTPPQANGDAASVNEDGSLTVPAGSGVLQNDTDAQGDLTAVLVSGPSDASAFDLNEDGSFSYTPASDFNGSDSFTYRASDGQAQSEVATVTITVNAVNDAPSFTKGADVGVIVGDGAQSMPGWATGISAGPANESDQILTLVFEVSTDNEALFASGPSIAADGTLTFIPAGVEGLATVTIRLTDSGGNTNGGSNTSAEQTFTITVGPAAEP